MTQRQLEYPEKLKNNLKEKYDLDLVHLQWYYYRGGDTGSHKNYKTITCQDLSIIPFEDFCVCGHKIKEQCYMKKENDDLSFAPDYIVMGNCCIKKYMKNGYRTCEKCKKQHKNRKNNLCNECRKIKI